MSEALVVGLLLGFSAGLFVQRIIGGYISLKKKNRHF